MLHGSNVISSSASVESHDNNLFNFAFDHSQCMEDITMITHSFLYFMWSRQLEIKKDISDMIRGCSLTYFYGRA